MTGEEISAAAARSINPARRLCELTVYNKAGAVLGAVTADSFMDFKRKCGKHIAVIVELQCGEEVKEIMVDTCKLLRRFPRGATYRARLLRRTSVIPAELAQEATGCQVWAEV